MWILFMCFFSVPTGHKSAVGEEFQSALTSWTRRRQEGPGFDNTRSIIFVSPIKNDRSRKSRSSTIGNRYFSTTWFRRSHVWLPMVWAAPSWPSDEFLWLWLPSATERRVKNQMRCLGNFTSSENYLKPQKFIKKYDCQAQTIYELVYDRVSQA